METQDLKTASSTNPQTIVTFTESALKQIKNIFERETTSQNTGLRLAVTAGGCSGMSYKMEFSTERAGDNIIKLEHFLVYIDDKSKPYLQGIELDFQDGLNGKGFIFNNPNAQSTCGCGESFSI